MQFGTLFQQSLKLGTDLIGLQTKQEYMMKHPAQLSADTNAIPDISGTTPHA